MILYHNLYKNRLFLSQGGVSDAFKKYIAENEVPDNTYDKEGVALFRVQGSGPENMQAIQIEAVRVLKTIIKQFYS